MMLAIFHQSKFVVTILFAELKLGNHNNLNIANIYFKDKIFIFRIEVVYRRVCSEYLFQIVDNYFKKQFFYGKFNMITSYLHYFFQRTRRTLTKMKGAAFLVDTVTIFEKIIFSVKTANYLRKFRNESN